MSNSDAADTLRQCADEIDRLRGQALSSIEREEYMQMKEDAARYRQVRKMVHGLAYAEGQRFYLPTMQTSGPLAGRVEDVFDRCIDRERGEG